MEIPDEIQIDSLEEFDALISPLRLRLAEIFREPATVKHAAAVLDVPATRLYYHVNALVDRGLVVVVEERKVGTMTERLFQTAAKSFRPSPDFLEKYGQEGLLEVIRLTFAEAENELRSAVEEGIVTLDEDDVERTVIGYSSMRVSEETLRDMVARINEVISDVPHDPDGILVRGLITLFPKSGQ